MRLIPFKPLKITVAILFVIIVFTAFIIQTTQAKKFEKDSVLDDAFNTLFISDYNEDAANEAITTIDRHWNDAYIPLILDTLAVPRNFDVFQKINQLLRVKTGENFIGNIHKWYFWLWNRPENVTSSYADFKADYYSIIDPKFDTYFRDRKESSTIRLDEIRWGGVVQDGIPPLHKPDMISAKKVKYLEDNHIVFGIKVNGDARAYPKRILAWHEMFTDTIGGVNIAGVYCTLCGTVIPYKTDINGKKYQLGTSGFLYRSNKLMYDKATQSLWSTVKGEPVVGPLVNKGIKLEHLGMVTTTWGEWKRRHPETKVLSLNTGHRRNYDEGAAYKDYFSDHRLMFHTPFKDERLKNKQEVLALVFPAAPKEQLAIDTEFLNKNSLFKSNIGRQKLIVLTDASGANRVYDPKDIDFVAYDQNKTLTDSNGNIWQLTEEKLLSSDGEKSLSNLPYRRAFWFGWHAAYPQTRLIM